MINEHEVHRTVGGQTIGKALHDPMEDVTCGNNLRRKIAEQKEKLKMLEDALVEMEQTGLADIKIRTLQNMMVY